MEDAFPKAVLSEQRPEGGEGFPGHKDLRALKPGDKRTWPVSGKKRPG